MENQANEKAPVFKVRVDVVWTSEQLETYLDEIEEVERQTSLDN